MIDLIIDLLSDLFDAGVDAASEIDWGSVIDGVISTGLILAATITVACITEDAIKQ